MLQPLEIEAGYFADARGAFVGMATAFGGPVASVVAVVVTAAARLIIGGGGALLGFVVIVATACSAGLWLYIFRDHSRRTRTAWVTLALASAGPTFVALHHLPIPHTELGLFLTVLTAVVVFAFGKMLHAEQRRGRRERLLSVAACTDALTGLPNRRAFEQYTRRLEETGADDVMLMLLDVDHFKSINDELGHDTGDIVLRSIGSAIRNTIRENDFAARIGGEEFAVIVRTRHPESALQIAERFRTAIQVPYDPADERRVSTISVGGFYFDGKPFRYDSGFRKADEALYSSKRSGRNRATVTAQLQYA